MSKPLSDFHDLLLPELPGCTVAMVNLHLVEVAREYCHATRCWRVTCDPIDLLAGVSTYDLDSPEPESEVVQVHQLTVNSVLLWQDRERDDRVATADRVAPRYERNDPPFQLALDSAEIVLLDREIPTADAVDGLQLDASLQPAVGAEHLPEFLFEQHREGVRTGVLSRLMLMNKKPWTDRLLALEYARRYTGVLSFTAYNAQTGQNRTRLRVKTWG